MPAPAQHFLPDKYLLFYDIICSFDEPVVDRLFHGLPLVARLDELAAKQFYY
jgi:hypothetical protein